MRTARNSEKLKASIVSHHTQAEDVGSHWHNGGCVKTVVLNHFVPPDDKPLTPNVWAGAVRKTCDGNIVVGTDLLQLLL